MNSPDTAVSLVTIGLRYVGDKLIMVVALFMTFSLFGWAIWQETILAIAVACSFAVLVFLPILFRIPQGDRRNASDHS